VGRIFLVVIDIDEREQSASVACAGVGQDSAGECAVEFGGDVVVWLLWIFGDDSMRGDVL